MTKILNHIHFQGGKGETVVFLHGIEEDGSFWFPIDRGVAEYHQSVSIDLLGYGQSPKDQNMDYTKSQHVEALKNTLDAAIPNQKVTLVGHSMGCYVAVGFAAAYPELVQRIVLISPVVILKDKDIEEAELTDAMKEEMLESVGAIREFMVRVSESPKTAPEFAASLKHFTDSSKNVAELVEKQDLPGDLAKISGIPVEIIYGAIDPLVVPDNIKYLAQKYPDISIRELPAGHDPVHQQPEAIFKIIVPDAEKVPDLIYQKLWRK